MKSHVLMLIIFMRFYLLFPLDICSKITSFGEIKFANFPINQKEFLDIMGENDVSKIVALKKYNYKNSDLYITFTVIENDKLLCGVLATNYLREGDFVYTPKNNWETNEGFEIGKSYNEFVEIYGLAKEIYKVDFSSYDSIAIYYYNDFELLYTKVYLKNNNVVGIEIWNGP